MHVGCADGLALAYGQGVVLGRDVGDGRGGVGERRGAQLGWRLGLFMGLPGITVGLCVCCKLSNIGFGGQGFLAGRLMVD